MPRKPGPLQMRLRTILLVAVVFGFVILLFWHSTGGRDEEGPIGVRNEAGRSGWFYIPVSSRSSAIPLLVFLHGSGGSGHDFIDALRPLAKAHHFVIVAPDSRRSPRGDFTWEPGDQPRQVTPDLTHTVDCIDWVRVHGRLTFDSSRVLIAGFSGGGSSAPYIASNQPLFSHMAVLHGGVFPGGIGPRRMPAWFSTGEEDRYRPVALVQQSADALSALGFSAVTFRPYPGGHELSEDELRDLVDWWLGQ